jgi:prepilin-type N-terminal cleavage/methylation domain-containing protein
MEMQIKAKSKKQKAAFTLVETLVAIAILLLAIGGPLTIAAQSFFAARFSKDNLTAIYLAQEGIEVVRYQRDSNSLAGADWLSGLSNCLGEKCFRGAFTNNPIFNACSAECIPLGYNETTNQYGYGNIPVSKYTREISVQQLSETEIVVTSIVKWSNGSIEREVELKENLYNWR